MLKYLLTEIWRRLKERNLNLSQFAWVFCILVFYNWFIDFDHYVATRKPRVEGSVSGVVDGYFRYDKGRWAGIYVVDDRRERHMIYINRLDLEYGRYRELFKLPCRADVRYIEKGFFSGAKKIAYRVVLSKCDSAGVVFARSADYAWNFHVKRLESLSWWVVGYPIFAFSMMLLDIALLLARRPAADRA